MKLATLLIVAGAYALGVKGAHDYLAAKVPHFSDKPAARIFVALQWPRFLGAMVMDQADFPGPD